MWQAVKGAADLGVIRPSSGAFLSSHKGLLSWDACRGQRRGHAERLQLLALPFGARQSAVPRGHRCCRCCSGLIEAAAVAQFGAVVVLAAVGSGLRVRYVAG